MDKEISIVSPAAFCPYNHETMTLYPNQSMGMHGKISEALIGEGHGFVEASDCITCRLMLEEFNDVLHGPRKSIATTRKKPATALCSLSFHGSRCGTNVEIDSGAPKKSGLSSSRTSLNDKKEATENVDEEEILKVESGVQVVDGIEESRVKENKEVHVEALHGDESGEAVKGM
ncbi:hypothetical protein YC2023_105387 [Brassica napus]